MPNLRSLTDKMMRDYVQYNGGTLLIQADSKTADIAYSMALSALNAETDVCKNIQIIDIDEWRDGSPLTEYNETHRDYIEQMLDDPDPSRNTFLYVYHKLDGESGFRNKMNRHLEERGKVGGIPNCDLRLLESLESVYDHNNPGFIDELFEFICREEEILIESDNGTRLTVIMNHERFNPAMSDGVLVPGFYANPIPAEVYVHPASADGTYVIDGLYGPLSGIEPFSGNPEKHMKALGKNPITWIFKHGYIAEDIRCDDPLIYDFVRKKVFEEDPENGRRLGEVGFPASFYILNGDLTGRLAIDEKGRMHSANGHGYKRRTRCDYDSSVHGDGLIRKATAYSRRLGKPFLIDNAYSPDIFRSLRV